MNELQKFASDACVVIESCQEVIGKLVEENRALRLSKKASAPDPAPDPAPAPAPAPSISFDEAGMQKAASAVYALHGSPSNCTPQDIADYWTTNPNSMLSTINKLASERLEATVSAGQEMGRIINKKASAKTDAVEQKADDAFWQNL